MFMNFLEQDLNENSICTYSIFFGQSNVMKYRPSYGILIQKMSIEFSTVSDFIRFKIMNFQVRLVKALLV